jgi:hypothetical protein
MSNQTIQIKKSTTTVAPASLLFGELACSTVSSNTCLFLGNSTGTAIKIYDQSEPLEVVYNNTYDKYVANGGSNTNNGQAGRPYETITYGLTQISAGGVLNVEAGTYTEDLTLSGVSKNLNGVYTTSYNSLTNIDGSITLTGSKTQVSNLSFVKTSSAITINNVSGEGFWFNNINVAPSVTTTNFLTVTSMATGYINISNCDFNNTTLKLNTLAVPIQVYIQNCRNMKIDAGANYIVFVDNVSSIQEVSTNSNIAVGYSNVNDFIIVNPTVFGLYLLGANLTINTVNFLKGSTILFDGTNAKLIYLYYNNLPAIYCANKATTYLKTGSSNYAPCATYPIVSVGF